MPLKPGSQAPDFELPDQDGRHRRLAELITDGPVVLFFYPAAFTPGCTKEACHFRDIAGEFAAVGAGIVGISGDSVDRQEAFATKHRLSYPLLADEKGEVAAAFGVKRLFPGLPPKRTTFVIGEDRRVIAAVSSEIDMNAHADKALEALRSLSSPRRDS